MKSIKPGRGPSAMGAVGSVAVALFGVCWTVGAISMGAPVFFPLFGVVFIIAAIVQAVYHSRNAVGEQRYSAFDIVESSQEPDPLSQRFGAVEAPEAPATDGPLHFCPYCGARLGDSFAFCAACGKKLPERS